MRSSNNSVVAVRLMRVSQTRKHTELLQLVLDLSQRARQLEGRLDRLHAEATQRGRSGGIAPTYNCRRGADARH